MCKARVSKSFRFEAAHQLTKVPPGHKCARLHGHSYRVEVEVEGEIDPRTGMVVDYADISAAMDPIIAKLDHRNLNTVFDNSGLWCHRETTSEELCRFLLSGLPAWVTSVRVFETDRTCVEVGRRDVG